MNPRKLMALSLVLGLGFAAPAAGQDESEPPPPVGRESDVDPADEQGTVAGPEPTEVQKEVDDLPAEDLDYVEPTTEGIEVITVTANKREEVIQDVPISMVALTSDFLDITNTHRFDRLEQFVPNLRILPTVSARSTSIRIRGIGSTGTNAGVDPSVGVFIDGVYQGRAGMSVQDFLDVERVEVLRGPQGTLYGKNTAAGAINVLSKRPTYERETRAEGVFADYGDYEFRGTINQPLVDERIAARISGYYVTRDGFDVNRFDFKDVNDDGRWGIKGRILFELLEELDFLLTVDYAKTNRKCCYADILNYKGPKALGETIGVDFDRLAEVEPPGSRFSTLPLPNGFDQVIGANFATQEMVSVGGVAGEFNGEVGDHVITWLTAWRLYESNAELDGDFSVYDAVVAGTATDLNQISSELRLTSPASEFIDYVAGLYFYYQEQDTTDFNSLQRQFMLAAPLVFKLLNIFAGNLALDPIKNWGFNTHKTYSVAGFGDATLHLGEQVELTGGLRATWEKKTRVGEQVSTVPNADVPPLLGPNTMKDQERSVTNVSGRAILRYYPVDDVMSYVSFSSGFKSGGFNQLRTAEGVPSEFDDESSLNVEGGVKTSWFERRLTANLTGFYTYYDNYQAQSFDGSSISIRNAASLESYGFEAELTGLAAPGLILGALVGFDIAKYKDFTNGECTVAQADATMPPCFQDLSGRPLDNAPKWSLATFAQYEFPFQIRTYPLVWYSRADYAFTSSLNLAQDLDPNLVQKPVSLLDLTTGIRAEEGTWDAQFWVRNVLDTRWNVAGIDVPALSGYAGFNAPPLRIGGTFRVNFF